MTTTGTTSGTTSATSRGTWGMDTAAGLAASHDLESGAQQVTELARLVETALHGFEWHGTDAERTRETWDGSGRPTLDTTAQHLSALALQIRQEAEAQDAVSDLGAAGTAAGAAIGADSGAAPGLLAAVRGWVGDRIDAAWAGLVRTGGHVADVLTKVADVVTGREDHTLVDIAASALAGVGSAAGTIANTITGEDQRWFGEGPGLTEPPRTVPTDPLLASDRQPVLTAPTDLPSLMQGVTDGYQVASADPDVRGDVRITRIDNGTGTPSYVVAVPGTERWWPDAGPVGRDLSANLQLMAGNPTAAAESVRRAMDAAGIPDGAPVLLVGHSQGGIIAGTLASDPAFAERYGQVSLVTFGAPIDHLHLDPSVQALALQHRFDVVPRLDLGGLDTSGAFGDPGARDDGDPRQSRQHLGPGRQPLAHRLSRLGARSPLVGQRDRIYPEGLSGDVGPLPRGSGGLGERGRRPRQSWT